MFRTFSGTTANEVWESIAAAFVSAGQPPYQESRLGPTLEFLHTALSIAEPRQRWVVSRQPALNPAYAVAEVIWILAGRNDARFLNYFNSRLPEFAGHGPSYYGAYGYRLRQNLGIDQIERAYRALRSNPESRQVVLQIWDSRLDLPAEDGKPRSEDIPCNIVSLLKIRDGKLEWMQVMRSNDLFRGLPYNIVQFTSLQEILAGWLEVAVGSYCQISDSMHVYEQDYASVCSFSPINAPSNTDSLAATKFESEKLFAELGRRLDIFVAETASRADHLRLAAWAEAPPAFRNMLCLVAAEAARRRSWFDEAAKIIGECTNPALVDSWKRWVLRCGQISAGARAAKARFKG